jgi:hypothetical protein
MKKNLSIIFVLLFIAVLIVPIAATAQTFNPEKGIVPCGNPGQPACEIKDFFIMLALIYDFIVWWIATPLAIIALTVGAIFMLISAGNPSLFGRGKQIIMWSIIGLVLVFCSWLIVNFIMETLGYAVRWDTL